jgi:hypothetical protein
MARYRIHQFDIKDHVTNSDTIDCSNDEEALRLFASVAIRSYAIELWMGRRLVRRHATAVPRKQTARMAWPRR